MPARGLVGLVAVGLLAGAPQKSTQEREDVLFVLNPLTKGAEGGAHVLWIPQPLEKYCIGKTAQQCSTIDHCIRTTNRNVAMCKNLGVGLARIPAYPPDTRPRRLLSVTYFPRAPIKGLDTLLNFLASNPIDRLSLGARLKGRIKFTTSAEDDDFELLEVVAAPL